MVSAPVVERTRAGLSFVGEPASEGGAPGLTQLDEPVIASSAYDAWGNALAQCAGTDLEGVAPLAPPAGC